jgi:hypothetical protein
MEMLCVKSLEPHSKRRSIKHIGIIVFDGVILADEDELEVGVPPYDPEDWP